MAKDNIYRNNDDQKNIASTWGECFIFSRSNFYYHENKPILKEANSNIRRGQN